jgi:hypothetical protein
VEFGPYCPLPLGRIGRPRRRAGHPPDIAVACDLPRIVYGVRCVVDGPHQTQRFTRLGLTSGDLETADSTSPGSPRMTLAMLPTCTSMMATGPVGDFSALIPTKSMLTVDILALRMCLRRQALACSSGAPVVRERPPVRADQQSPGWSEWCDQPGRPRGLRR